MKFMTENGTWYEINKEAMTWKRLKGTDRSGNTRRDEGKLTHWPEIKMGESAILQDKDVLEGMTHHGVITSHVVVIKE